MRGESPAGAAGGSPPEDGGQRREDDPQSNIAATGKGGGVAGAIFRRGASSVAATARSAGAAQAEAKRVAAAAKETARKEAADAAFLKPPTVFADQDADGVPTEFDDAKHCRYHAKYYFTAPEKAEDEEPAGEEGAGCCRCFGCCARREEGGGTTSAPMGDAERSPAASLAYHEFLTGLSLVNQQANLKDDHTGAKADRIGDVTLTKKDQARLGKIAEWERVVRERAQASTVANWSQILHARSQMGLALPADQCISGHLPIRKETRDMLMRPPEVEFQIFRAIMQVYAAGQYVFAIGVQVSVLCAVCAVAFLCPDQAQCGLAAVAPPLASRLSYPSGAPASLTFKGTHKAWEPGMAPSCKFGTEGCLNPGYQIEWPYLETAGGTAVASAVQAVCTGVMAGDEGWLLDPFTRHLRGEYYRCDEVDMVFEEVAGTRSTPFTLHLAYYKAAHRLTLLCMDEVLLTDGARLNITARADFIGVPQALTLLQDCLGEQQAELSALSMCSCGLFKWEHFSTRHLYAGGEPTHVCKGGHKSGKLCDLYSPLGAAQCPEGTCRLKWADSQPLNASTRWGCFFSSPDAGGPVDPTYVPCGETLAGAVTGTTFTGDPSQGDLQRALNMQLSKRTTLITIFLVKESSGIGAFFIVTFLSFALTLIAAILWVVLFPFLYFAWLRNNKPAQFWFAEKCVFVAEYALEQLRVISVLFTNLSTSYRCLKIFKGLVIDRQCNVSIEDMDSKITGLANTVYLLVQLLALSETSPCATEVSVLASRNALVLSLVLGLLNMIWEMVSEKVFLTNIQCLLKDLNENRLNKFEAALVLVKIMEDFLPDDVYFNWVSLFRSPEPLVPAVEDKDLHTCIAAYDKAEAAEKPRRQLSLNATQAANAIRKRIMGADAKDQRLMYMPDLPRSLANKFGHDGDRHFFAGGRAAARCKAGHTAQAQPMEVGGAVALLQPRQEARVLGISQISGGARRELGAGELFYGRARTAGLGLSRTFNTTSSPPAESLSGVFNAPVPPARPPAMHAYDAPPIVASLVKVEGLQVRTSGSNLDEEEEAALRSSLRAARQEALALRGELAAVLAGRAAPDREEPVEVLAARQDLSGSYRQDPAESYRQDPGRYLHPDGLPRPSAEGGGGGWDWPDF